MTPIVMLVGALTAVFVQVLVPPAAILGQAKAPLLLGVVLYYALRRRSELMLLAAVLAGLLQDGLGGIPLGYSSSIFALTGALVARFRRLVLTEAAVTQAFFGFTGAAAAGLVLLVLLVKDGLVMLSVPRAMLRIAGGAVLGALTTPLVCLGLGWLDRIFGNLPVVKDVEGPNSELNGFA